MEKQSFALRGNICYTATPEKLETHRRAYVVCEQGVCRGVFEQLPDRYDGIPVRDQGDALIFPGMVDLHIHAPQYTFRGTGMDCELLAWLNTYTFPEEVKYEDVDYARAAYGVFAQKMKESATTRAVIFATIHTQATIELMRLLENSGLISYVGKVNMDRNAPEKLRQRGADVAALDTIAWIDEVLEKCCFERTKPIVTPRFIPCCSDELLDKLGKIQRTYGLAVQSHLSENPGEVEWVKELMPDISFYGEGYDRYGLFGRDAKTVMAHCVYSTKEEIARIAANGVYVAHCPNSNMNLASGIAPIRTYLNQGILVGLGSDVAGGQTESIFRAVTDAVQVSKLYWRYMDQSCKPLSFSEAFYLATKGGGRFFGQVGSFEPGYEFDAIVIEDAASFPSDLSDLAGRAQSAFYLSLDIAGGIREKYVAGRRIALDRKAEKNYHLFGRNLYAENILSDSQMS